MNLPPVPTGAIAATRPKNLPPALEETSLVGTSSGLGGIQSASGGSERSAGSGRRGKESSGQPVSPHEGTEPVVDQSSATSGAQGVVASQAISNMIAV